MLILLKFLVKLKQLFISDLLLPFKYTKYIVALFIGFRYLQKIYNKIIKIYIPLSFKFLIDNLGLKYLINILKLFITNIEQSLFYKLLIF